jgi:hypothetical protein
MNAFAGAGHTNVIVRFKAISNYGNNLYIDNVNISNSPMGIGEEQSIGHLDIYPNPFSAEATIVYTLKDAQHVTIRVSGMLGETVWYSDQGLQPAGMNSALFDGAYLPRGIYILTIKAGETMRSCKLIRTN